MRFERYSTGNLHNAIFVAENLLKHHGSFPEGWILLIELCREVALRPGENKAIWDGKVRNYFKQALHQVKNYPEKLWEDYENFERECGSLQDFEAACAKVRSLRAETLKIQVKEQLKEQRKLERQKEKMEKRNGGEKSKKRQRGIVEEMAPKRPKSKLQLCSVFFLCC
jgi:hypothetical protein